MRTLCFSAVITTLWALRAPPDGSFLAVASTTFVIASKAPAVAAASTSSPAPPAFSTAPAAARTLPSLHGRDATAAPSSASAPSRDAPPTGSAAATPAASPWHADQNPHECASATAAATVSTSRRETFGQCRPVASRRSQRSIISPVDR